MSIRVAIAGATGNLGTPILQALLNAGLSVTVLSRMDSSSSKLTPHPHLTIKEVDFGSIASLAPAMHGVEVVVSCVATMAIGGQNSLIDASIAAGVKRFIPAEFGMDSANTLAMQLPVCAPKAATQRYLAQKALSNPGFTWTAIANGLFLDWGLKMGLILNVAEHTATLYNGGNVPFSATNLADVARAVLGVISHREQTANRIVYVHSARVTQNQLIRYAREKDGKPWNTTIKDTGEVQRESMAELAKGLEADVDAAMLGFCFCGSFNSEYGCDFSEHLDNELLDIKELHDTELKAMIQNVHYDTVSVR
ncbi:oxidoreductase CipA-like protein [Truncatella angustata]|uniref:Oxidoreductase CipA-like protein n=1 Tax=Truncatella angustata TaxID=152316 RepID=A0A9P8UP89_9PEZI|nr:oxidoreductase CipA-like protein [Truncatella angustata]KAH6655921.1 oxidoreductase CipA-like protein [Truncatella angustata]